ncbi:hypothetical protein K501DRAFT_332965 [Backusella circina FSU 941]|nr:hypothetical protein K501DRAFT_332965 [Backusella circina FSU 941]
MATTPEPISDPLTTTTSTTSTAIKCGDSEQENDIFQKLLQTKLPIDQLAQLVQEQRTLTFDTMMETFDSITFRITEWLEIAHLTAFTLEQNVKQESEGVKQTEPLETACSEMAPLMSSLLELKDMIEERPDAEPALQTKCKLAITKIQSEWSGLQHFISSVKKTVQELDEKSHLQLLMENIFLQIDDLSLMIFQFQEKRHQQPAHPESVMVDPALMPGATSLSNTVVAATEEKPKEDEILVEIDNRVGPLFNDVEKVYTRMTSNTPPEDNNGLLTRKHLLVQERWECLRIEIDELKLELKEDRWLAVFRQVADQVDTMMDGLEKTVNQCLHVQRSSPSVSSSTMNTSSIGGASSPSGEKIRSIEKNFEAKYKYYTPSITKMLMMLGNGIAARVSRNVATLQRHEAMVQRWNQLKSTMDQLRRKDIPDIEKVMLDRPVSPSSSRYSDHSDKSQLSWMDGRFRSPEPNDMLDYRPGTIGSRSKSPFTSLSHHYEDLQRAASGTPNGGARDNHLWWSMNHHSTSPVYGRSSSSQQQQQQQQIRTTSPLSHSRENYSSLGGSGLRSSTSESSCTNSSPSRLSNNYPSQVKTPTTNSKSIKTRHEPGYGPERQRSSSNNKSDETKSWMQHTKSTIIRNEASRAKTPTNHQRPKSRQQLVRSTTPSMIPRPNEGRASPSMIPRPRSSMTTRNQSDTVKSNGPFHHRENKQIRKQFSVPALRSTKDRRDYPDHKDEFRVTRKDTAVK